jgi:hypothetical protein
MDRVNDNEISVRINCGDESYLFDPHYDTVHIYPWLGHSIMRIITEDGQLQLHAHQVYGESVCERAGITPKIEEKIGRRAFTAYLRYQEETISDAWLNE